MENHETNDVENEECDDESKADADNENRAVDKEKRREKRPPEVVQVVEPLKFFDQIFGIYIRANKDRKTYSVLTDNVRRISMLALVRLSEYFKILEKEDGEPLAVELETIQELWVGKF